MGGEPEQLGFDLAAASVRADAAETARALESFARKLEAALPSASRVTRRRSRPFGGQARVTAIDVELGSSRFHLSSSRGSMTAERIDHVHDMSRRTHRLSVAEWLGSLEAALRERAETSAQELAALERLLEAD